jgi:hypothetical protein
MAAVHASVRRHAVPAVASDEAGRCDQRVRYRTSGPMWVEELAGGVFVGSVD